MLKVVAGLVAGVIVALAAIYVVWLIGLQIFPFRPEAEFESVEGLGAAIQTMSLGTQFCVVLSWFAGAFLGASTAAHISRRLWPAWVTAAFVTLSCLGNVLMFPHPEWMQLAAIIVPIFGGLVATHMAGRSLRRPMVANG